MSGCKIVRLSDVRFQLLPTGQPGAKTGFGTRFGLERPVGIDFRPISDVLDQNECQNRFGTGSKPVSEPGCPVGNYWNRTFDNRRLELESTGQYCPDFR